VFQNVLLNRDSGKTRILVTHALHFLPQVDFIYVVDEGTIAEQGTYNDLMDRGDAFARFINEFGSSEQGAAEKEGIQSSTHPKEQAGEDEKDTKLMNAAAGAALMQEEERNIGAVSGAVYKAYYKAGHGGILTPFLIVSVLMMNVSSILSSYWYFCLFIFEERVLT
jgi:ABC-type Fe3+/spermidine/putrescine transport system ATPase subunit